MTAPAGGLLPKMTFGVGLEVLVPIRQDAVFKFVRLLKTSVPVACWTNRLKSCAWLDEADLQLVVAGIIVDDTLELVELGPKVVGRARKARAGDDLPIRLPGGLSMPTTKRTIG